MAQNEVNQFLETDQDNTDITGTTVVQGQMYPYMVDDAFRKLMGSLKRTFRSDLFRLRDSTTQTKQLAFGLSGITAGTTRTLTVPDKSGTLATVSDIIPPAKGYIFGLALTNNATDATNDIDIATGEASSDAATPTVMTLASALTKRIDANWAVGNNQGGLDTGAATNTTYYVWLIQRSDTGVVDVLFSASATSPTLPTSYDRKRAIGQFTRTAGVNGAVQTRTTTEQTAGRDAIGAMAVNGSGQVVTLTSVSEQLFTGIPADTNEVLIDFLYLGNSGGNAIRLRLGTSAGLVTSGYKGTAAQIFAGTPAFVTTPDSFTIYTTSASQRPDGYARLSRIQNNDWSLTLSAAGDTTSNYYLSAGVVSLPGTLDRFALSAGNLIAGGIVNVRTRK